MKTMIILGIALILLGVVMFIYQGIPYKSERDTIRVGPMQTTVETKKTMAVPPIISGLVLAGGVALVVLGLRKKT